MSVIDQYLVKVSEPQKSELERIRKIVIQAVPEVEETISYGMPVFKLNGKYVIGMSVFKNHMSVFPGSEPIEEFKKDLKDFKTSKGTIQFTVENPLPEKLLKEIILACVR
ncbi:DUF1801 domain-containing protein [Candidatus Saccharibacteria bacterium]|nr:DUF1801 domain-containing protein [Candidatus Saccharibacteria bacterium]